VKKDYIEDLKDALEESPLLKDEMYTVLKEYDLLYDEYMDEGLAPSEVEKRLGEPSDIVGDILRARKTKTPWLDPTVYFTFLFSGILYLMIGYFFNLWHPSWLVFFLAPLVVVFKRR